MADKYLIHGAAFCGDGTASNEALGSVVTITIATPGVVSWVAHGLAADTPVYFSTTGALPTGLVAGTKYYVRNPAADTFEVSATAGGASIATSGTQSGTHTVSGVGAWNDINVFHNTSSTTSTAPAYGTLAANDRVFIRSKTSAGADITITLAVSNYLGLSGITADANRVMWILDDGAIWAGIGGTMTIAGVTFDAVLRTGNNLIAGTKERIRFTSSTNVSNTSLKLSGANIIQGIHFDVSNVVTGYSRACLQSINSALASSVFPSSEANDCTFLTGKYSTVLTSYANEMVLNNPTIVCDGVAPYNPAAPIQPFGAGGTCRVIINGGSISGNLVTTGFRLFSVSTGTPAFVELFGFHYPNTIDLWAPTTRHTSTILSFAADAKLGSERWDSAGHITSRSDNYPPLLNATLPTSDAAKWTWRAYPYDASRSRPVRIRANKVYTEAAGVKTITQELLVPTTHSPTKEDVWLVVNYVDSTTGLPKQASSRVSAGAITGLDSSTAVWTATTWGSVLFNKAKVSVTTPTAVKQDTAVIVTLYIGLKAGSAYDIYFVDPDVQVS